MSPIGAYRNFSSPRTSRFVTWYRQQFLLLFCRQRVLIQSHGHAHACDVGVRTHGRPDCITHLHPLEQLAGFPCVWYATHLHLHDGHVGQHYGGILCIKKTTFLAMSFSLLIFSLLILVMKASTSLTSLIQWPCFGR